MFNSKFNTLLTVLLIIAIIGIIGLMGYFGYSVYSKYYINKEAGGAIDAFENAISNNTNTVTPPPAEENVVDNVTIGGVSEGDPITSTPDSSNSSILTTYKRL